VNPHRAAPTVVPDDPEPVLTYTRAWVGRGRSLATLADLAHVPYRPLSDLHAGRVRWSRCPNLAARVLAVPLPPSDVGVTRRVRALLTRGHPLGWVAAHAGISDNAVSKAMLRQRFGDSTAYALTALYDEYSGMWGSSRLTASKAITLGYRPPDAWYQLDIDDPDTVPWPGPGPAGRPADVTPFFSPDYYYTQTGQWPSRWVA